MWCRRNKSIWGFSTNCDTMKRCNDKLNPPEFTREQIVECEKCRHASKKKLWCCFFGVWIRKPERSRIIRPGGRKQYPSVPKMARSLTKSTATYIAAGRPKRTPAEIAFIRKICESCDEYSKPKSRCYKCGCWLGKKWKWKTEHCPLDNPKW